MLRHFYTLLQDAHPRYAVPEAIPCGDYTILMTELRDTPDAPAPAGWLWEVTDRSLLLEFAAGTVGIPGCKGYQHALDIATRVLPTLVKQERH